MNLFVTKPVSPSAHVDAGEPVEGSLQGEATLKRSLTAGHLMLLGIGAVVGAGIFVVTGQAAVTAVCYRGISQFAFVNSIVVTIKEAVILLFVVFSSQVIDPANWQPYVRVLVL